MASKVNKQLVLGSFGVAGFVLLVCILDLSPLKIPFGGSMMLDILFLISAAIVGYLAWDAYRDLT